MGSYLRKRLSTSVLTRKGVVLGVMVALHCLAIAGLMKMGIADRVMAPPEQPVEVVLIREVTPVAPRQPTPQLQAVELRVPTLPVVEAPLVESPAPLTAISVVAPDKAPVQVETPDLAAPINVDEVEYLSRVPPRYPVAARRARAEGTVYLRILIDEEGTPRDVRVQRSCGHELLDEAARDAARRFRFKPHRVNGIPRNVQAIVPIEFSLTVQTANLR